MNFDTNYLNKFKNKIALIDTNNVKYSYNDLINESKKLEKKFVKNSLILLVTSNSIESIIGYFSFLNKNKNCKIIILDESFGNDYFNKIMSIYKPNYVFYPSKFFIKKKESTKCHIYKNYIIRKTKNSTHTKINHENFVLLSSSGTTGNPKFIRLSRGNIVTNTQSIIKSLNITSNHKTITTMPMGYSYGLSIINTHILSGATIVINKNTVLEKIFWLKVSKYKISSFGGVPQLYQFIKKINFHKFNLPKLKYITVAGGHLDLGIKKYFVNLSLKKKFKFFAMYGQTEASPRISCFNTALNRSKLDSIGKPINGVKLMIFDEKNKIITKPFRKGEISVMGSNVCLGYASKLKDLHKGDINKSLIKTGDIGFFDNEKYFYITGRKKKISKILGIRVDLNDIENYLKKKNITSYCHPSNKKLKIKIMKNYDESKILNLINKKYKINKNFIEISKTKISKKYTFKKID
jgi:acyl-CoA synthetase (AMP-forming)/AMP-acid ligase II|tara:strand:+ start:4782 stop:6176 length:1395 start_codon:yes stop_codon:yes gene_type:complete